MPESEKSPRNVVTRTKTIKNDPVKAIRHNGTLQQILDEAAITEQAQLQAKEMKHKLQHMERSFENVVNKTTLPSFTHLDRHDSLTKMTKSELKTRTIDTATLTHGTKTHTVDLGNPKEGKKHETTTENQIFGTSRRRMHNLTILATARATKSSSNTSVSDKQRD
jgi:hypothetical protein